MMKNILSALVVLSLFGVSFVGLLFLYQYAFDEEPRVRELNPEEAALEISQRLGEPFVKAWVARDAEGIRALAKGEFGGGMATEIEWSTETEPPFETKKRSCTEEEEVSTNEFDQFFGCLLDPIAGLDHVQTEFSVLNAIYYSRKNGDMYHCRLLLRATGINENDAVKTFQSEADVIVTLPMLHSIVPPAFRTWQIREETISESTEPVAGQIRDLLSKQGIEISSQTRFSIDVADLDDDNDSDMAVTLPGGKRFVFTFDGEKYNDDTQSLGISSDDGQTDDQSSFRTVWFDFNEDGFPDLISGNRIFENKNGKSFVDVTDEVGLKELMGPLDINAMGLVRQHYLGTE